jgi:DMSO/TMAO reductase YedYZ molybdopterin-dependent catalytic subunit
MDERIVVTAEPLNAETPLARQRGVITPVGSHYVRSHFARPASPRELVVDGAVGREARYDDAAIRALPSRTRLVTLECAGNGRAFLDPTVPGEQWRLGAVGTAEWTGVPLRALLERAELRPSAREILFRGADRGRPKELGGEIAFERSLPVADALEEDVLVAYAMNGEPLAPEHGAPWRLVVPGRYGVASVKWLERITATLAPFAGFYQRTKYVIDGVPLGRIAPRAVIVEPVDGAEIRATMPPGDPQARVIAVRGYAWSGAGAITKVEVSAAPAGLGGERRWREAKIAPARSPYAWREFHLDLLLESERKGSGDGGDVELLARAADASGASQPLSQNRNALGYMNNAARPVRVRVV